MIEGDTLTVQVKEPCAEGYIHPEWVGDEYLDFIKGEMMDDCLEGCEDENADACAAKCNALTVRGKGGSVSPNLYFTSTLIILLTIFGI